MILLKYIPFSLHWIVKNCIGDNIKTVLDLGCGDGTFTKDISFKENWQITGVELYSGAIDQARKSRVYKEVIKADVTKVSQSILNQKFDLVLSSQVIEHLNKEVGEECLKKWEKLTRKKIIITTPVGFIEFDRVEKRGKEKNKLQNHLSGWSPEEFENRGYRVYGQGAKLIYGENGLVRKVHPIFWPFLIIFSYLFAPLAFYYPSLGTYMIAVKDVN